MDNITPEQRRKTMQAIKSANTKIEILFGKAMWAKGYRYRKNDKKVVGKPDFTLKKYKVAIFCDSAFWHGRDWKILQKKIHTNRLYWFAKIERNIDRDKIVNKTLKKEGWIVLRFWETDIRQNIDSCLKSIQNALNQRMLDN